MAEKKLIKALVLFSGGLDSRLVAKILQEQGINVELFYFKLPFGCEYELEESKKFAIENNFKIKFIDCTKSPLLQDYLKMLLHPKYGRGSSFNPCIDCKIFIFRKAKEYADKNKIAIIATGEVLGERPMSQHKHALLLIEEEAKLKGRILRPLSAKLLPETEMEKKNIVDRSFLLDIKGRARKLQIELAKKYQITYPTPAGGCRLCEKEYCKKLKDLLKNKPIEEIKSEDLVVLKGFRHFRKAGKIILGRNHQENLRLLKLNKKLKYNVLIAPKSAPGPTVIFENSEDKYIAEQLMKAYSSDNLELRKKFEEFKI